MPEFIVGTYPYRNRHAIMDAVQAGLLPHTRCEGDDVHLGCVTVIVKVTPPAAMADLLNFGPTAKMVYYDEVGGPVDVEVWDKIIGAKLSPPPDRARGCATKVTGHSSGGSDGEADQADQAD